MGRKHSAEFKSKVALLAIKTEMTMAEMCSKYEIHRSLITNWRKQACDGIINAFKEKRDKEKKEMREKSCFAKNRSLFKNLKAPLLL